MPPRRSSAAQGNLLKPGSLFEEDFFQRTFGDLIRVPDVALTELVANAWDAGACKVTVEIPEKTGGVLSVTDDGSGLTKDEFAQRWMTLAYNRQRHQGADVQFPPERSEWRRKAYGRNGQGRHGLLCFGDEYDVETWRDGTCCRFHVAEGAGKEPLRSTLANESRRSGHGTIV